jgi:L-alanine-DL-glutamate epimerase-like enolase superfamily enzyme
MSRVDCIDTYICRMPKRRDWLQHGMAMTLEQRVLLRLRTDDGIEGWGEATALPQWGGMGGRYYGETVQSVTHVVHDLLAPTVLGSDPTKPRALMDHLDTVIIGHPYAKAMVESALQDIRGKICGQPLYNLLGGAYRDGIQIGHMLGLMATEEAVDEAKQAIEVDGITAFQIKGGTDPQRDIALVRKLRQHLPGDIFLRLDGNKGYGKFPKELANIMRCLETEGIDAIEQPAASIAGLRACRGATKIPIIADEGCWTANDVLELWRAEAVDAVSVYVAKAGGIERASEVARTCALVGYRCDVNGSLETGVGNGASVHMALAAETLTLPSVIPVPSLRERHLTEFGGRYWEDDIVRSGFSYDGGYLRMSDAPGLGIEVDVKRLQRYAGDSLRSSRS